MSGTNDFDRRLGDWLEDGAQSVPDWVVEDALARAHASPQLGAGLRLPWIGRRLGSGAVGRLAPLALGAIGALAVVSAFVLGLWSAPRIGDDPTPSPVPTISPPPTFTSRPTGGLLRSLEGLQAIDVLPQDTGTVYTLFGLAATQNAVWTVAVTADPGSGDPVSRLVRIDATSGQAQLVAIAGVLGNLSPPVAEGEIVWTASAGGLHRIDASGATPSVTVPLSFEPGEIATSAEGLWIARRGGSNLIDPETGEVLREIAASAGSRLARIVGAPISGTLWECAAGSLVRLDALSGQQTATIRLPADEGDSCRHAVAVSLEGLGDGVIPLFANVVIDPRSDTISAEFELGGISYDVITIDGRLWFQVALDETGGEALVEVDPVTGQASQTVLLPASGYSSTIFQSRNLAVAGEHLWVLADPTLDAPDGPQIVRVPLAELQLP